MTMILMEKEIPWEDDYNEEETNCARRQIMSFKDMTMRLSRRNGSRTKPSTVRMMSHKIFQMCQKSLN